MKKKEADFSVLLRHYIMSEPRFAQSASIEVKDSRGKDFISFSEMKEEQLNSGLANKRGPKGNLIRVASGTIGAADYIWLYRSCAYFAIKYPGQFSIIDVETMQMEKERSKRRSLTSARAEAIAIKTIRL